MRKSQLLFPILALTIVLGSCSSGGDEETPGDPAAQAPASTPAAPTAPVTPPNAAANGEDAPDLLASASAASNSVFIPSTDPEARRKATTEGRVDPFGDLPLQIDVEFIPERPKKPIPAASQKVQSVSSINNERSATAPKTPESLNPATATNTNNGGTSSGGFDNNNTLPTLDPPAGSLRTSLDFEPVLPEIPMATLAENTQITGVITLNGVDNVMLQEPDEDESRYVQVGDTIADGQVTVKSVDFRDGSTIVVLEQFGVEVYKEVEDVLMADRSDSSSDKETSES